MPRIPYQNFCGPGYQGRSISIASDRTINLYTQINRSNSRRGQEVYDLIGTPGIRQVCTTGKTEPIRGICVKGKEIIFAGRETLYWINDAAVVTEIGAIAPDDEWDGLGKVTMEWNGTEYLICSGGHIYTLNKATKTLTDVTDQIDTDYVDMIAYLDGYFIALASSDRKVLLSALYDGSTWNALDYAEKESSRDYPISMIADHGELWIFGETHSEVWWNSGNSDFPLDPVPQGRLEFGCSGKWSPVKLDNSVFWIGNDERGNRVAWRADGYQAKKISIPSIDYRMNLMVPQATGPSLTATTATFSIGWAYQEEGHSFWVNIFPKAPLELRAAGNQFTQPTALVYDVATGHWHERTWLNPGTGAFEPPRQRCHAYIWDHHLVGDRENGIIYEQLLDFYDDNGDKIRRERIGPQINDMRRRIFYRGFELEMEVAVGLGAIDTSIYGADADGQEYEP